MKNYKKYIGCLSLSVLTLIGCEDLKFGEKFLDKPISNEQNIDSVFNKKVYAEQALAETYHSLPDYLPMQGRLGYGVLEMLTDLGDWTKKGAPKFYTGTVDGTNTYLEHLPYRLDVANTTIGVGPVYGIRRAYIYIENVDRVPDMTADEKAIGKAEAQVIIAYHYSQMLRYYGGMPWIDHAYTAEDAMKFPRMTVEETVQKIVGLLDAAASVLPWQVNADNDGRMTAASALALKSRVLQFVASPLFNAEKPYLEGDASSQFLTWYGNYSPDRWQKALDAGLEFMRANKKNSDAYQLVNTGNPRDDFAAGYFNRHNGEVLISSRRFTTYATGKLPFAQVRYGVASPTLTYVDMFQMKDGTEFDWNNPDHNKFPFFDKDGNPRRDIRYDDRATPPGIFTLYYKKSPDVLRGKQLANGKYEYEQPVTYWMPFNGGIGFHDANWQPYFGGDRFMEGGSHGCINMPPEKAAELYNIIECNIPIVCFY